MEYITTSWKACNCILARNESVWESFKVQAKNIGSSMSMAVANNLLIAVVKTQLGL